MFNAVIYIGGITVCERGAVGTHTKGIIDAFERISNIEKIYLIGGKLDCFQHSDKTQLRDIGISTDTLENQSLVSKLKIHKKISDNILEELKKILSSHMAESVLIYHRYSVTSSKKVIKFLRKNAPEAKVVLEYNDITVDQLQFARNKGEWGSIGGLIRTNTLSLKMIELREKYCFKAASLNIAVTDGLKDYITSLAPSAKVAVVPNATDAGLIHQYLNCNKDELRAQLGLNKSLFYFAHIGTFTHWDGIIEFLEAFNECKERTRMRVLFIGHGAILNEINDTVKKLQLENFVTIMPPMDQRDAQKYLAAVDAIPLIKTISSYQLSPIKFYESLGLGKLMITSDVPYINSVRELGFGEVVALPLKQKAIINAIQNVYNRRHELEEISHRIKSFASRECTWDRRVEQILNAVEQKK